MRLFNLNSMISNLNYKIITRLYQNKLILTLIFSFATTYALAHHPHDMIDAIAVSPSYETDNTIFIANAERLYRSRNGGYNWQELANGLDHKYNISHIEITDSSRDLYTVFISTFGSGVYRSTNSGLSWEKTNKGLHNLNIKYVSSQSNGFILALDTSGQLYTSMDNGNTWFVAQTPENTVITSISQQTQLIDGKIIAGDNQGKILSSADGGAHWKNIANLPVESNITVIVFDPSDSSGSTYFLATKDNGLYKTTDNGASFQILSDGQLPNNIVSLTLSANFPLTQTMIATSWREAAFISSDGGSSWKKYDKGLSTDKQADSPAYKSPHFSNVNIVSDDNQTIFLAAFTGLFKSDTGGRSWYELETKPVSLIADLAVSPSLNEKHSIAISTYGGGFYISEDYGESWIIGNKGLNTTRLMDIEFSPSFHDDKTLFSGSIGRLLRSTDGGNSWEQIKLSHRSLKKKLIYKLKSLGIDLQQYLSKAERSLVYPTVFSPSPNYVSDKILFFGTRRHGIYHSKENGQNAQNIWENTNGAVTSLSLSPNFQEDSTLFSYLRGVGIFQSTDSGNNWHKAVNGLPKMQSEKGDFSIVFSPDYSNDQTLFVAGPLGLYVSTTKGNSWDSLEVKPFGYSPNIRAMGISPDYINDNTLIISLKGHGLYLSKDGGKNFTKVGKALINNNHTIEKIIFSPNYTNDQTLYAASEGSLFKSNDKGVNWALIHRPIRYENHRDVIHYEGDWIEDKNNEYSASSIHYSTNLGDKATFIFYGCGIRLISTKSPDGGIANIFIDTSLIDSIDLYSDKFEAMSTVFTKENLNCNPHTITLEVAEPKKRDKARKRVTLDAFDALPDSSALKGHLPVYE